MDAANEFFYAQRSLFSRVQTRYLESWLESACIGRSPVPLLRSGPWCWDALTATPATPLIHLGFISRLKK